MTRAQLEAQPTAELTLRVQDPAAAVVSVPATPSITLSAPVALPVTAHARMVRERWTGVVGVLTHAPVEGTELWFLNGLLCRPGDYALDPEDVTECVYWTYSNQRPVP